MAIRILTTWPGIKRATRRLRARVCARLLLVRLKPCCPPLLLCYNIILKHTHLGFNLYPDIDVLHYRMNIHRVRLLKRLYGFGKQLLNCSAGNLIAANPDVLGRKT